MKNRSSLFALLALASVAATPAASAQLSEVRHLGRVAADGAGRMTLEWPGTGFETRVYGRGLVATISDTWGDNYLDVEVDGQTHVVDLNQGPGTYTLFSGGQGEHFVRVTRRTGSQSGAVQILDVRPDGRMAKTQAPDRRILAIGGSLITGYGVEGADETCVSQHSDLNVNLAFPTLTAREFGADIQTVAIDGRGLVRNFDPGAPALDRMAWMASPTGFALWPINAYVPDVIILSLGVTDFTADTNPPGFAEAYDGLLRRIRADWPEAHVFATFGGGLTGANYDAALAAVQAAVEARNAAGDDKVHFQLLTLAPEGRRFGCSWHPGIDSHRNMAAEIETAIMQHVSWKPLDFKKVSNNDAFAAVSSGNPAATQPH